MQTHFMTCVSLGTSGSSISSLRLNVVGFSTSPSTVIVHSSNISWSSATPFSEFSMRR